MDCAIITGADNPMGQAIARRVVDMGYRVYGLGQFKNGSAFEHRQFHPLGCDLTQPGKIAETVKAITDENRIVSLLIHAATFAPDQGSQSEFSSLEPGSVETLMRIHLLGPVLLTRLLINQLGGGHGHIFFLTPPTDSPRLLNPALASAGAGIRRFSSELFNEWRDRGLRVTTMTLQSNPTQSTAGAPTRKDGQDYLNPKQVARAIEQTLRTASEDNVVTELVLRPQIPSGAAPVPKTGSMTDPYREIMLPPSKHFPVEPAPLVIPQPVTLSQTIDPEDLEKISGKNRPRTKSSARKSSRKREDRSDHQDSAAKGGGSDSRSGGGPRRKSRSGKADSRSADAPDKTRKDEKEPPKKKNQPAPRKKAPRGKKADSGQSKAPPEKQAAPKKKSAPKKRRRRPRKPDGGAKG